MLDGQNVVVAVYAQLADDIVPLQLAVTVAHRAERPAALAEICVRSGVQHAVAGDVGAVQPCVLGVEEMNGALQLADGHHRVDPLPEQVARVEVRADDFAHGFAQPKQRRRIIHAEPRVHFQRDLLNAVRRGEGGRLFPVGDQHVVPLILQCGAEIRRPGAGDPVWGFVQRAAAGAAAEPHDAADAQLLRQQYGAYEIVVIRLRDRSVGVYGVAVHAQRGNLQPVPPEGFLERAQFLFVVQQYGGVAVRLAGIAAAAHLHRLYAFGLQKRAGLVQGLVSKHDAEYG